MLTRLLGAVSIAVLLLLAPSHAKSPAVSTAGAAALTERIDAATARGEIPAAVVLVTNADGVVYEHAAGKLSVAGNVPLPKDAIFRIASMTKPVTSVAIMMLVESGTLKLDDPAAQYAPAIGTMKVATDVKPDASFTPRAPKRAITVRDLLTHTSGIGYSFTDPLLFKLETAGKPETDFPLLFDPGEKWSYGSSTRQLGTIVERVSGQPLDAFLRSRIFEPLGMNDTSYEVASSARQRTVTVHQRANGVLTEQPNPDMIRTTPIRGDGGLFSTAQDYGKFLRMFLNGGRAGSTRILTEASIRDMTRNQIGRLVVPEQPAANALRTRPFPLGAGKDTWGLGFQLAAKPASPTARGAGSYSWAGINNTHFWVDPVRQVGVVVLMQVLPFYDEACIRLLTDVEHLVNKNLQ